MFFTDRAEAGRRLASLLISIRHKNPIILGLPRGGVPVALAISSELALPMDLIIVRKLGVPWQPELAFGAVGEGGEIILNHQMIEELGISTRDREEIISREMKVIGQRRSLYRGGREPLDLEGRSVVIVDDGIATGATVEVACKEARKRGASEVIVASPVASRQAIDHLATVADSCSILFIPKEFDAVGLWYQNFAAVSDDEVVAAMARGNYGG